MKIQRGLSKKTTHATLGSYEIAVNPADSILQTHSKAHQSLRRTKP